MTLDDIKAMFKPSQQWRYTAVTESYTQWFDDKVIPERKFIFVTEIRDQVEGDAEEGYEVYAYSKDRYPLSGRFYLQLPHPDNLIEARTGYLHYAGCYAIKPKDTTYELELIQPA